MLAEEIDFHKIFRIHPTAMALLTADLEFIDANDELLESSGRQLSDLVGKNMFAVFPKMPYRPGCPKWTSVEQAQTTGVRSTAVLTRYDIEDPAQPGVFRERYWSTIVVPIRGDDGRVEVIEVSAREVTEIIDQFRALGPEPDEPT